METIISDIVVVPRKCLIGSVSRGETSFTCNWILAKINDFILDLINSSMPNYFTGNLSQ